MILLFKFDLSFIQPGCKFQPEPLGNDYKYDNDSDCAVHDITLIALITVAYRKITDTASADYPHDGGIRYETDKCSGKTDNKGTPRLHEIGRASCRERGETSAGAGPCNEIT